MTASYLYGGTAVTMNSKGEILEDAVVEIVDGKIKSIKSDKNFRAPSGSQSLDCRGCLVMPGLINAHTHSPMTLLRGIGDDLPLHQWLTEKMFPLETKWGNKEFCYFGTLLATAEMIRSGTTTFNDMYYHQEQVAKASHEAGMRAVCGQTLVEINQVEEKTDITKKFDEYLASIAEYPLVHKAIGPHSVYGVTDKTWRELIKYAQSRDLLVHMHLSETLQEETEIKKKTGKTSTEFFRDLGLWECKVIAAHAVVVNETDIGILGRHKVGIAHNPESNLKLGNPIAPIADLRAKGCNVALGTDSVASNNNLDLLQEADTAAKVQILRKGIGHLTAEDTVKLLTIEGARALHLDKTIGSLEAGKSADIIAVDTEKPHAQPLYSPYSHLVYSAMGSDVKHSMVAGKVLMEGYRLKTLDEEAILREAKAWGKKIAGSA